MPKISSEIEINIRLEIESVTLVETGITILSGSRFLLYEIVEMEYTKITIIVTKIRPENVLIGIILSNPTPIVPNIIEDSSASIPINGKIKIAKI